MSTTDQQGDRKTLGGIGGIDYAGDGRHPRAGRSHIGKYGVVVAALVMGLIAGTVWHAPLLAMFHGHGESSASGGTSAVKQLWTCSMHSQVIKEEPGLCPICHMALTPKADSGSSAGKVQIDAVVVQNMGVRVATVTTGPITREVRAVGYLDEAQSNVRDVNLRVSGWVEKLHADTVGMALSKGAPLFELYSPEVQVAADELIAARKSLDALGPTADALSRKTSQTLFDATRLKLEQWGLDADQVQRLAKLDHPPRSVTFNSPIDGYLTQKMVSQGAAVKSGDTVLRIVDLSNVWLDSQLYAQDLPSVRLGATVTATVEGLPGKQFEGQVIFIQPELDPQTRTATVRIALPNMELALRPGMYATARIRTTLAKEATLVPREAVIDTGARQIVFISAGEGKFEPRLVKIGAEGEGGIVQIVSGLMPGETVVTSGQFLLDAESRMREAVQKHLDQQLLVKARGRTAATPVAAEPPTSPVAATALAHEDQTAHPPPPVTVGTQEVDRLFAAYLIIQQQLGAPQQAGTPIDASPLVETAKAVAGEGGALAPLAQKVAEAAAAFEGKKLAEQRNLFKPLSDATIALAKALPPSSAVAQKLYVAFCPMAPGDGARWLQTSDRISNPYFATSMKECGSIEGTLSTAKPPATQPASKEGRP